MKRTLIIISIILITLATFTGCTLDTLKNPITDPIVCNLSE